MNVLVTGASGFLGRYLVAHLKKKYPQATLFTVCKNPLTVEGGQHAVLDLNDETALRKLLQSVRPDQIYHLAGIARISENFTLPDYFNNNTKNTITLLNILKEIPRKVSLFFSSSVHVYGNQTTLVDESSPVHPQSPYAFTKYLAERAIESHVAENPNLTAIVGRIYSCIGPGQPEGFVASDLCQKIHRLENKPNTVLKVGPLKSYRRFLDVRDTVQVLPVLLESKHSNRFEIFNLASPHEMLIEEMLKILISISKKNPKIESSDMSDNAFKGLQIKADKLYELFPPSQFRPVKETLKDMYENGGSYRQ